MHLAHKVLGVQNGIQRLSLQQVLAVHLLQVNNTKHSSVDKIDGSDHPVPPKNWKTNRTEQNMLAIHLLKMNTMQEISRQVRTAQKRTGYTPTLNPEQSDKIRTEQKRAKRNRTGLKRNAVRHDYINT